MSRPRLALLPLALTALAVWLTPSVAPPAPVAAAEPTAAPAFRTAGVAFVEKYCLSCHSGDRPKADLNLKPYADDAALLKDRKTWQRVVEVMRAGEMPPKNKPQPMTTEAEAFAKLVEGVFEHADRTAKPDPGRVTMRRLNRLEYNNTVRDLLFVDVAPADDFPSDDVGHGFDNIGDVLTLPPVLLERYLAAAEAVTERAITPTPPKVSERWQGGPYLEPAGPNVPVTKGWRVVSGKPDGDPIQTGPVHTPYKVSADGEYVFRARVYAETTGKAPVKVAILACTKEPGAKAATDAEADALSGAAVKSLRPFVVLKTVEVTGREPNKAETIEVPVPADPGLRRMAVALVKPPAGEPAPILYVQSMVLKGPLDPRPASHRKLLACDPNKPQPAQTREVLTRFVTRAFRRPAKPEEVERYATFVDAAVGRGEKWEAGIQLAMQAVLVSPKFLFRVELEDRPDGPEPRPLDEFQLASRLSYFLWASMPDDELFDLAARKQLTPNLDAQVRRMLKDPRSRSLVDSFVMQWLQLQNLKNFQPDKAKFPNFDDRLRASMAEETKRFFEAIIREDRSVLDVIDADFTYVNSTLARHYGLSEKNGSVPRRRYGQPEEFVRVDLKGTNRGGILTQASVLAVTSNPTRTSPVKRGRWVLEQLLGTPPPPPPPDVPELEQDGKPLTAGSLRQRMEEHRKNPACANCHAKMDPLGFAFENFDAVGAFRDKDENVKVDPSGELPDGTMFSGPAELKKILLAKKDLFARCLTEKLLTYALGRGLEYYDKRPVDRIVGELAKNDYKFSVLVAEIVKSDPFRLRRGKDTP